MTSAEMGIYDWAFRRAMMAARGQTNGTVASGQYGHVPLTDWIRGRQILMDHWLSTAVTHWRVKVE